MRQVWARHGRQEGHGDPRQGVADFGRKVWVRRVPSGRGMVRQDWLGSAR